MNAQLWAIAAVGIVVLVAAGLEAYRSARRSAARSRSNVRKGRGAVHHLLHGRGLHGVPHAPGAGAREAGRVRVEKVDAIADRELADRFHVYTLPTTVVMSSEAARCT